MCDEITINGVVYVPKANVERSASVDGMECVVVRTYSAGVFYGYLAERNGKEVKLLQAKRIWRWSGAASLSQIAVDGVSKPKECKIPCAVSSILLTEAIEILPLSKKGFDSLEGVPVWRE